MFLVNLPPDLWKVQRIAFLGENVHILYVFKIASDSSVLLLMESPWIFNITNYNRKRIYCLKTNDFDNYVASRSNPWKAIDLWRAVWDIPNWQENQCII